MTGLPLLADVAGAAEHCSYCPKMCRFACPVAEATGLESVTPWGIDRVITQMARGVTLSAAEQEPVWACTGCRQCGGACVPGLDLPTHVRAARAVAVKPPGIDAAAGREVGPDAALADGATPGASLVIYPGCRSEDGAALGQLLHAAGIAYDVIGAATCCGARDADIGGPDTATQRALQVAEALAGASSVIVADPHCARWLSVDMGDTRVRTVTAFLAELVGDLPLTGSAQAVTWHDPCWLGRGMTEYDQARVVVSAAAGGPALEPEHTRDRAWCTGGGMGYPETDPAGAAEVLRRRAEDLRATGATVAVTACPTAAQRLRLAGLDAYDLPSYVASRLQGAP